MRITEVDKKVTQADIDQLEVFADRLFAKVGIDVEFTRHFLDRVNDERNIKQITMSELTRLFKQEYKRWGKPIAQLGPDAEAVMKDMVTDINLPFALRWDHQNKELDLVAKTVMRKADFKTSNQEFAVEDVKQSGVLKVINNIAMRRDNDPFPIKFENGKLIYVKPLTARKILHVFDIAPQEAIDKFMTYIKTPNGFKELAQLANNRIKTSVVREAPNEGLKSLFKPNAYAVAAKKLHSVLQRKKQENDAEGKPFRHALGWYASNIAGSYRTHINTNELISYYQDNYDAVLSESDLPYITEEAALKLDYDQLKIKIPANDNAKPKTGQVIDLNARRAAAKEALSKMSDVEKKAANEFIKKNKTLLQRLSAVGARSAARHGIATVSSGLTGPAAPVVATVLNVTLLGWDLVDAGVAVWKWARSSDGKDIGQGNANREFGNDFALEIPTYPTTWPMDRTGTVLKRKQSEWMEEFGNTHLRNGDLNPSAGYQDAIIKIAKADVDAKNKASDNELIKKEPEKELEKAPVINFTEIPQLEVPEFKPGEIEIPRPTKDREIDIEIPKFPNAPSKDKPFKQPEYPKGPKIDTTSPSELPNPKIDTKNPKVPDSTPSDQPDIEIPAFPNAPSKDKPFKQPEYPTGPNIDPNYNPKQPKNPHDPESPEVPDSNPSDQPDIEIPQPLKAPRLDRPFIPPLEVPSPEIAFQKDAPPVIKTKLGGATPPGSGNSKNNNKKRKKKKDYSGGGDVDYNDPLQRWQKKYGTWEPRSR